ncbi:hypothetical protein LSH36_995g01101 [Paralvinella palmiformis]|uniref:Nephrocystin 3-like N-terminal domain-containing protein n=1 Tax=Paralvinella palmiformis TaxID=53620 RepID=A0AAD9MT75_9ANNE|nr:hypothetical protein LSH36_995g01101 [Paralvinella palmiformis]
MASTRFEVGGSTSKLLVALRPVETEISWSTEVIKAFDLINTIYTLYNEVEEVTRAVYDMIQKVKDFETFISIDIVRHIALRNGRRPYYLLRAVSLLQRTLDAVQTLDVMDESSPGPWPDRYWHHLAAEIQATLTEYGFSTTMCAIYDVDEAGKKLDAVNVKLDKIKKSIRQGGDSDVSVTILDLYGAAADYNGIGQSMTMNNIEKMAARFEKTKDEIARLVADFCASYVESKSNLFLRYLAGQFLLQKAFVDRLQHSDSGIIIGQHMIHPGTRGWLMERFNQWLTNDNKRLIVIAGKQGSGKTAFASAICKLYGQHQVACHFFGDARHPGAASNRLNGLIQNLAYDLCHSLPEYLNYLDDRIGSVDMGGLLNEDWRMNYDTLLKRPLQFLYGKGKSKGSDRRPLIVIDALDECLEADWKDLRAFVAAFLADLSTSFCLFVTVRSKYLGELIPPLSPDDQDSTEGIRLEDRAWINWHIKDIEIYLSTSLGAILSGEDERGVPKHAKADTMTLQNAIDELLKASSGRFDYAVELMESFAAEMGGSGQFLSSLKKSMVPVRLRHGDLFERKVGDFASPYRAYRDKEGRSGKVDKESLVDTLSVIAWTHPCFLCYYFGHQSWKSTDYVLNLWITCVCWMFPSVFALQP